MHVFTIEKIGPFCVKDGEGNILKIATKSEVMEEARTLATEIAAIGEDAQVQELDSHGRVLRLLPFYTSRPGEEETEEEAEGV